MAIPLAYNLRNLVVRKTTTIMTAFGIALTVAVLVADLALVHGLRTAFQASGNPQQILVLRKGATAEVSSSVTRQAYQDLKFMPGIAVNGAREPMASPEVVTVINLPSIDSPKGMNITLRGLPPAGMEMRDTKIQEGRWFRSGQREVVAGKSVAKRYPGARLGKRVRFGKGEWEVVGVMDGGQSAINSEIWGDLNQIGSDFNRQDSFSSILIRATDAAEVPALVRSLEDDRRLNVSAMSERDYYDRQTSAGAPMQFLGVLISAIMAVGSSFAAMNTMYAAVARRSKEIGTLRALGFSRGSIMLSFLVESLLLSMLGGILGCVLVLPLNNVTTGVGSFVTFSEIAFNFRVDPASMITGIAFAMVVGAIGGLFPARMAAHKDVLVALREV
ncbi:MAG: ABC transporter permease [Acidobacteria bacterium]|nr:MAG: ABC transporter permease [Acidobacteriota bacterium]